MRLQRLHSPFQPRMDSRKIEMEITKNVQNGLMLHPCGWKGLFAIREIDLDWRDNCDNDQPIVY